MINYKPLLIFDFETTGKSPLTAELTQIAAIVVDSRKLTILDEFNRDYIKPLKWELVEEEALRITKKDRTKLEDGIHPKQAWTEFTSFVHQYNPKRSAWNAPMPAGYNIMGYDMPILERYCQEYGPTDAKNGKQSLVSGFMNFDLMQHIFWWNESNQELPDIKLDTIRDLVGLGKDNSHDALQDVKDTALIIIKMLRLYRSLSPKVKFRDSCVSG